jgi:hypothetical protein
MIIISYKNCYWLNYFLRDRKRECVYIQTSLLAIVLHAVNYSTSLLGKKLFLNISKRLSKGKYSAVIQVT